MSNEEFHETVGMSLVERQPSIPWLDDALYDAELAEDWGAVDSLLREQEILEEQ